MHAPLADVLVADLTQNVAGPFCSQILGDLGAEVVKIERTGRGDDARAWAPPYWGEESATFMSVNRNKRSLAVDLKSAEGRAIVERLLGRADVFVQSLRAGAVEDLGLGWDRARAINPRLVYCSVTAFGTEGPLADRPGYDPLMQAMSGIMSITGHPGAPPARVPVSLVDMGTGMWAATAIVAALRERDRTGQGTHITTALFDTALAWTAFQTNQYLANGEVPLPQGSGTAMICPYEAFPGRDAWVMIAAGSDALFAKVCEALGAPALAADPQRESHQLRSVRERQVDVRSGRGRELHGAALGEVGERAHEVVVERVPDAAQAFELGVPPERERMTLARFPRRSRPLGQVALDDPLAARIPEHGAEHGLCQTYANEPWHYELHPDAMTGGCPASYADPTHDPRLR